MVLSVLVCISRSRFSRFPNSVSAFFFWAANSLFFSSICCSFSWPYWIKNKFFSSKFSKMLIRSFASLNGISNSSSESSSTLRSFFWMLRSSITLPLLRSSSIECKFLSFYVPRIILALLSSASRSAFLWRRWFSLAAARSYFLFSIISRSRWGIKSSKKSLNPSSLSRISRFLLMEDWIVPQSSEKVLSSACASFFCFLSASSS